MFGIDIFDASLLPALFVALFSGLISFLSPCVLPIVPPYLAYMSGVALTDVDNKKGRQKIVLTALFFVLGLSTVFVFLGFSASAIGAVFFEYQALLNTIAGFAIMLFGLHFLDIYRLHFLDREARFEVGNYQGTAFGSYVLGLAFAFGWTPCIGPQLGAILSLAASNGSIVKGTVLLAFYAIGLGIPFLIFAFFINRLDGVLSFFKQYFELIERIMGLLLWTVGLLMLTGGFSSISFWLLETFPSLAVLG
ncbi:cytochrome c biogenesis protein CcdA [Paracoccaceae bacterium]|nr:cytochrome c biogenesis protein CcdA [Paracoccaceae bacterium]